MLESARRANRSLKLLKGFCAPPVAMVWRPKLHHQSGETDGGSFRLRSRLVLRRGNAEPERDNSFFQELYRGISGLLVEGGGALFGFEGREHTAQVEGDLRELREARFRFGSDDQKALDRKGGTAERATGRQPLSADALLLPYNGVGRRYLVDERRLPAQRAPNTGQLRPARRACRTQRSSGTDCDLLRGPKPARSVFLPATKRDGRRDRDPTLDRPCEPGPCREPSPRRVARRQWRSLFRPRFQKIWT